MSSRHWCADALAGYRAGQTNKRKNDSQSLTLKLKEITNGVFNESIVVHYDSNLLPKDALAPFFVKFESVVYLVDEYKGEINDGVLLIEIDGFASVRQIYRLRRQVKS